MDETERHRDKSTAQIEKCLRYLEIRLKRSLRDPKFILEILVFIVLITYTTFAALQWYEMHNALRIDQRAWVGVVSADPPDLRPKPDFFVMLHVTNSGHTPALNFHSETVLHSLKKDDTFEPVYDALVDTPSRGVIQPSEVIFVQSNRYPLTQPQIDWVTNGQFILYVYGRMSYDDIFHVTHHTTFCKEILSQSLVKDCGTYNTAD